MNTSSSSPMLSNSPPVESDQSMVSKPLMVMEASRSHIRSPPFAMASSGEPTCKSPLLFEPSSTTRKLMRSESTYGEDLFEDKIPSKLNQRHVLRQQWFRKNNSHMSRLRRSTSTASNSSSSSSGISLKGESSGTANTSSFGSSFSSSFSATLSSLSESCDHTDSNMAPVSSEGDYPRILHRSSFKNKLASCYKPYYKPRRFSLQLVKNLELPENFKFFTVKTNLYDLNRTVMKGSLSCYSMGGNKENRSLHYTLANASSNPTSPNKCRTVPHCSEQVGTSCSNGYESSGGLGPGGAPLLRSKSLDDLNFSTFYSSSCFEHEDVQSDALQSTSPLEMGLQWRWAHAGDEPTSSRVQKGLSPKGFDSKRVRVQVASLCDVAKSSCSGQVEFESAGGFYSGSSGTFGNLAPSSAFGLTTSTRGISISSSEISGTIAPQPPGLNNTSLCDIDHVMKKISSLHV